MNESDFNEEFILISKHKIRKISVMRYQRGKKKDRHQKSKRKREERQKKVNEDENMEGSS